MNILLKGHVRCALFDKRNNNTKDVLQLILKTYTLQSWIKFHNELKGDNNRFAWNYILS